MEALLPQPDPEALTDQERDAVESMMRYAWARGVSDPTDYTVVNAALRKIQRGGESVPGQPDPVVERLRAERDAYIERLNEVNVQRQKQEVRAIVAEESLRAVTEAARGLFEALEPWAILPELPASESRVLDAADALRTVLSSHPEAQSTEEEK